MEDKKVKAGSIAVGICLFIIAILLVVIVLFFYNSNKEKNNLQEKISELETIVEEKDEKVNELENKISKASDVIGNKDNITENVAKNIKPKEIINTLITNKDLEKEDWQEIEFYSDEFFIGDEIYSNLQSKYKASSEYKESSNEYNVENLGELTIDECWCEGVSGDGIGETIEIDTFDSCEKVEWNGKYSMKSQEDTIEYLLSEYNTDPGKADNSPQITKENISDYYNYIEKIAIINGYAKNDELWKNNNRVKKLKLTIDNKLEYILELEDSKNLQIFDISYKNDSIINKINLKFEILEVYNGDKYDDNCLTSLYLSGGSNVMWGGR